MYQADNSVVAYMNSTCLFSFNESLIDSKQPSSVKRTKDSNKGGH